MGKFPRRLKYANRVGKLKDFDDNRGEFRGTGFKHYNWDTIRVFGFRGIEQE